MTLLRLYSSPATLLVCTTFMWGTNAIAGQLAVGEISPMTLVFVRWLLVATTLTALFHKDLIKAWPLLQPSLIGLTIAGFCGLTAFNVLFYIASYYTAGANIGIIQGVMPVMVMIGAYLAFGDRITVIQGAGVAIAIIGVIVLAGEGNLAGLAALKFNIGDLIMFANCALYAGYTVALRKRPPIRGIVLFTFFSIVAFVTSIPMFVWELLQPAYVAPTTKGWAVSVFIAVAPSFIAQVFFMRAVDLVGPGKAGVYVNLVPFFATGLAVIILGETLALYHGIALLLVFAGIALTQKGQPKAS
ncbi:MAG: DMT family transporter [Pikeienuella sp.]